MNYSPIKPKETVTLLAALQGIPLPHVAAGVAVFAGLCWLFKDDEKTDENERESTVEPLEIPYRENATVNGEISTVESNGSSTVNQPLESVQKALNEPLESATRTVPADDEKAQIRAAMSALGKKSAAARRKRREEYEALLNLPVNAPADSEITEHTA